ncbi:hypothetical protein HZC00_04280 [Candidatus Kaiserbacteria bacterium]|nr:hypothetical protein [Candidatus Kaiserbacteria bacterium]
MVFLSVGTKINALAELICDKKRVDLQAIMLPKNKRSKAELEARLLLIAAAHRTPEILDGQIQDILECSQNEIRQAIHSVDISPELSAVAIAICAAFEKRSAPVHEPKLTPREIAQKVSETLGVDLDQIASPARAEKNRRVATGRQAIALLTMDAMKGKAEDLYVIFSVYSRISVMRIVGHARGRRRTDPVFRDTVDTLCHSFGLSMSSTA